nr:MAG TPA: hypothetical protein [Caudoviricetes sp.]
MSSPARKSSSGRSQRSTTAPRCLIPRCES